MRLLRTISLALLIPALPQAEEVGLLILRAPLAGSQYYAVNALGDALAVGDRLTLTREPDNRFDRRAIRVEWQGQPLGYLPRRHNRAIAAALDRGETLHATIQAINLAGSPWQRLELAVWLAL